MAEEYSKLYYVGAFSYESEAAGKKAEAEQAKIMKLEGQMDYGNPKVIYSVYCKIIDREILETLEGVTYLLHLQNYLFDNEAELPGPIPVIPSSMLRKAGLFEETDKVEVTAEDNKEEEKAQEENSQEDDEGVGALKRLQESRNYSEADLKKAVITARKTEAVTSKIIIAFLTIIILAMLVITFTSNSPNIVNYRNEIQNEYADWEQQLKDKEDELNAREREINSQNNQ